MKIDTTLATSPNAVSLERDRGGEEEDSRFRHNNKTSEQQPLDPGGIQPVMVDVGQLGHAIQEQVEDVRQTSTAGLKALAESVTKLDDLASSLQREATTYSSSGVVEISGSDSMDMIVTSVEATLAAREELAGLHDRFVIIDDRANEMAKAAVHNDKALQYVLSECMSVQRELERARSQALEDERQVSETQQVSDCGRCIPPPPLLEG